VWRPNVGVEASRSRWWPLCAQLSQSSHCYIYEGICGAQQHPQVPHCVVVSEQDPAIRLLLQSLTGLGRPASGLVLHTEADSMAPHSLTPFHLRCFWLDASELLYNPPTRLAVH